MTSSTYLAGALTIGLTVSAVALATSLATSLGTSLVRSAANAQTVGSGQTGSGQTGGSVAFVREAGNAGQFEVRSGRLALERSQHVAVRGYAGQTVKDADEMINRVKFINHAHVGAAMPDGMDTNQQARLVQLAGLSGPDFDRVYMQSQIEVGERLRKTFTDYGANGEAPTMRVYAANAVTDYDAQILRARTIAGAL